jgi:glutathione synthase/RimK-type ligase-like ATP-grasp enzyme
MKKILILSRSDDEHVERLTDELEKLGHKWVCFDPGEFPEQVNLCVHLGERTDTAELELPNGKQILLEEIGSVWYRRPTPLQADNHLPIMQQIFIEREARAGLWGILRSIDGAWVNHPDAIRESAYKPRQLWMARRLGLNIPRTLITNNPDDFERFYEECQGKVIYKLMGFPYYEVENGAVVSTFTSLVPVDMLKEAYRIKRTAHLFQEYQRKICDLRIIIIGEQLFAIEIHPLSEETRIDFRRDYRALRYEVHCLPQEIELALFSMARTYRLHYAAIDLLYTTEKQYLFLELNPVGQLGWLEEPTGLPLFQTLAHFLARNI